MRDFQGEGKILHVENPFQDMRPGSALRLLVAAFCVGVEAFMQPGLTGGLQLRQVALTCT